MRDTNLVNALREHAEWAQANEWETPITLGDDLAEAADRIEAQAKEIDALRNKLCLKLRDQELVSAIRRLKVETGSLACMGCGHEHNCGASGCAVMREAADRIANQSTHIAALQQEIEKLRAHQQRIGMEGM